MIERAIIDAGPLVAFLDRDQTHHKWVVEQLKHLKPPLLVCEAALTEVMFLLRRMPAAQNALFDLLANGSISIGFNLAENLSSVQALLIKYADRPISLTDACLIRMSELNTGHRVFTLDSDFHFYRKFGRELISLIYPD